MVEKYVELFFTICYNAYMSYNVTIPYPHPNFDIAYMWVHDNVRDTPFEHSFAPILSYTYKFHDSSQAVEFAIRFL